MTVEVAIVDVENRLQWLERLEYGETKHDEILAQIEETEKQSYPEEFEGRQR